MTKQGSRFNKLAAENSDNAKQTPEKEEKKMDTKIVNERCEHPNVGDPTNDILRKASLSYHDVVQGDDNLKLDFKSTETHDFIASLGETRLGKLQSVSFHNVENEEISLYDFLKHNFPNKVKYCEIWNSDFKYMTHETFDELKHAIRHHITSKLSMQALKGKLQINASQLNAILENVVNVEYLKFSILTIVPNEDIKIDHTKFSNLKGVELHDDHEATSKEYTNFGIAFLKEIAEHPESFQNLDKLIISRVFRKKCVEYLDTIKENMPDLQVV